MTQYAPLEGFCFKEFVGRATYIHRMEVVAHDLQVLIIKMKFVPVMTQRHQISQPCRNWHYKAGKM